MKSRKLRGLHELQKKLRDGPEELYYQVMLALFEHHSKIECLSELSLSFRERRFADALIQADSLSAQKYTDATTHFVANQFALLIKKYPWDPRVVKTNPEAEAIKAFRKSERRCFLLNRKFALYDKSRSPYEFFLQRMRGFVRYVLDDIPNLEEILDNSAFGAGASVGVHGNATNLARKILSEKWSVTPSASTYAYWSLMRNPHLSHLLYSRISGSCEPVRDFSLVCYDFESAKFAFKAKVSYIDYNKISFVPKTAKTHRAIAVEPLLNGFVQKGIDQVMRKRLARVGIDLSDQSKNQEYARLGSIPDSVDPYVTIDLSSASDSISIGLVRSIIPPEWFELLDATRSKYFKLGKSRERYSKFCSMGNGFCFPLESLIFAACCSACGCGEPGTDFLVYGDDIIVRQSKSGEVLRLLKVLGFTPNANKTFVNGPFRESCGSDWFNGEDVRPYTLDEKLDSLQNLFKWVNLTKRNDRSRLFFYGTDSIILSHIPHRFQFYRPVKGNADTGIDAYGDEHLSSSTCSFDRRSMTWRCEELRQRAFADEAMCDASNRRFTVDMYALLSGVKSRAKLVEYTIRRKTSTSIGLAVYGKSSSTWLPPTDLEKIRWETGCDLPLAA
jgi:hypothetical protein